MNWREFTKKLFSLAEPYLEARGDLLHIQIAHQSALFLMKREGGNKWVIEPAIILHDVGWSKLTPDEITRAYGKRAVGEEGKRLNRIHEVEGAAIARGILEPLELEPLWVEEITKIIERHDSGRQADTLEEKLVKDADKLYRVSKPGFWNEVKRQKMLPEERYQYLLERYESWFFTPIALDVAGEQLKKRAREISEDLGREEK